MGVDAATSAGMRYVAPPQGFRDPDEECEGNTGGVLLRRPLIMLDGVDERPSTELVSYPIRVAVGAAVRQRHSHVS